MWLESWLSADREARAAIDEVLDAEESPSEPRAARDLSRALPSGSTLVVSSSMPVRDLDWFMPPRAGLHVIANRGVNGIDGFISTALGVAAVRGSAIALVGDLATLHDQNGFLNARHRELNVVFVVLNNEGGGIFSFLPQARREHFESLFSTPQSVSFRALADLYGVRHRLIESATDLVPAVDAAAASPGVDVVEVRTDRRANVELHERIWARASRRLDDALG
jgi:2-succinyl-5-enolpyruvyl-6-hydroxy-3-cyclohexene-1-carboxylate synthase